MQDTHSKALYPQPLSRLEHYRSLGVRRVAGVMSGTSLDGVDVAVVELSGTSPALRLLDYREYPLPDRLRDSLVEACSGTLPMRDLFALSARLGLYYAECVEQSVQRAVPSGSIDAVGVHGQTVYHAPELEPAGVTVQIGDAAAVAERVGSGVGTIVVSDFRSNDVALGGQGAPLVPWCDLQLLHSPERNRVALNVGGIANITWLSRGATPDTLLAFDTGPGNMMIDRAMARLYNCPYDAEGGTAAAGRVDGDVLALLQQDPYFSAPPPKSTGRERFGIERADTVIDDALARGVAPNDLVATLTRLTAWSIGEGVRLAADGAVIDEVVVSGGGARNAALLRMLREEMPASAIHRSDDLGLPSDAKEAICFALLADAALHERPATLPSVTGARRASVAGAIRIGGGGGRQA